MSANCPHAPGDDCRRGDVVRVRHLCALNTSDGNPRRVYVGYDKAGQIVAVADERYDGYNAARWVRAAWDLEIDWETNRVTIATYKAMLAITGLTAEPRVRV